MSGIQACAEVEIAGAGSVPELGARLLSEVGAQVRIRPGPGAAADPVLWARCGAMGLTGRPDGAPQLPPGPLATRAAACLAALNALCGDRLVGVDGPALLGERAGIAGLTRRGDVSPGGSCRLLPSADGWIALNLARPGDALDLPAWLDAPAAREDPWAFARRHVAQRADAELCERAAWLGLAVARSEPAPAEAPGWLRIARRGAATSARAPDARPIVVDLSALWAGPLATHLLWLAGARVHKVESTTRPDGARLGPQPFYDLLNHGKTSVALPLGSEGGRDRLRRLLARADVVVESARPRALAQLGIDAEAFVAERPGRSWVSITGYGRRDPAPGRVAFGDDAGVAAGLASGMASRDGAPLFCGDAIADPLTGMHAALAAWASWRAGGGHLLDLALRDVAADAAHGSAASDGVRVSRADGGWVVEGPGLRERVRAARARPPRGPARALGADTEAVLRSPDA